MVLTGVITGKSMSTTNLDMTATGSFYNWYVIVPKEGCAVIIRIGEYISYIGPFDDYDSLDESFPPVMVEYK